MEKLYTAKARATGGRNGKAATDDGRLSVDLTHPVAPGRPAHGTDPEQLFACGYAACYGGAYEFAAKQKGLTLGAPVTVESEVSLMKKPDVGFTIEVLLTVKVAGIAQPDAEAVAELAHKICPYSNATHGNIVVATTVVAA